MKKILISVITILAVTTATIGATQALFTDEEVSTGNTFTAGTLDLTVDGVNGTQVKSFTMNNMKPGDRFGRKYFILKNNGSVTGIPKICLTNLVNTESNGTTEYENDGNPGELGDNLSLIVDVEGSWLMTAGHKLNTFDGRCWTPTDPADNEFATKGKETLEAGETMIFGIRLDLPENTGNDVQGDSVTFDLEFSLEQAN